MQDRFRLEDESDAKAMRLSKAIFQRAARKFVTDSLSNARIQAVCNYYKKVEKVNMGRKEGRTLHLTEQQYLQSSVDWIMKDMDAWRWLCRYRGSQDCMCRNWFDLCFIIVEIVFASTGAPKNSSRCRIPKEKIG